MILAHEPGGASIKNVLQWVQCYRKGKLSRFDFGSDGNMLKYGQKTSPEYCFKHLKEVPFHSYLFRGQKDAVMP